MLKKTEIGIDLGSNSIKIATVGIGSNLRISTLQHYETYDVNCKPYTKEYYQLLKSCIKRFAKKYRLSNLSLNITLPIDNVNSHMAFINMPSLDNKILEHGVTVEAEQNMMVQGMPDSHFTWKILKENEELNEYKIVLAYIRKDIIKSLSQFKTIKWKINRVMLQPIVLERITENNDVVIDFGHQSTRVYLYTEGKLSEVEMIDLGGIDILKNIDNYIKANRADQIDVKDIIKSVNVYNKTLMSLDLQNNVSTTTDESSVFEDIETTTNESSIFEDIEPIVIETSVMQEDDSDMLEDEPVVNSDDSQLTFNELEIEEIDYTQLDINKNNKLADIDNNINQLNLSLEKLKTELQQIEEEQEVESAKDINNTVEKENEKDFIDELLYEYIIRNKKEEESKQPDTIKENQNIQENNMFDDSEVFDNSELIDEINNLKEEILTLEKEKDKVIETYENDKLTLEDEHAKKTQFAKDDYEAAITKQRIAQEQAAATKQAEQTRLAESNRLVKELDAGANSEVIYDGELLENLSYAIDDKINELIDEIKRVIRMFELQNGSSVDSVYYMGQLSNLRYLKESIESELDIELKPVDILDISDELESNITLYSAASLVSMDAKLKDNTNFAKFIKANVDYTSVIIIALVMSLSTGLSFKMVSDNYNDTIKDLKTVQNTQTETINTINNEISSITNAIENSENFISKIDSIRELGDKWLSDILYIIPDKIPLTVSVHDLSIKENQIVLRGYSVDYSSIGFFAHRLENIAEVEIDSIDEYEEDNIIYTVDATNPDKTSEDYKVTKQFVITLNYKGELGNLRGDLDTEEVE